MKKILLMVSLLLITIILFNTINKVYSQKFNDVDNEKIFKNYLYVDFEKLSETNEDIEGWIIVKHTDINYPIMKADNNEFYRNHDFNLNVNKKGCIFQETSEKSLNSQNITLYGNNLNKSMFADLRKIHNQELGTDIYIKIITEKYINTYKVYETEKNNVINNSFEIDVTSDDNILILKSLGGTYEYTVKAMQIGKD